MNLKAFITMCAIAMVCPAITAQDPGNDPIEGAANETLNSSSEIAQEANQESRELARDAQQTERDLSREARQESREISPGTQPDLNTGQELDTRQEVDTRQESGDLKADTRQFGNNEVDRSADRVPDQRRRVDSRAGQSQEGIRQSNSDTEQYIDQGNQRYQSGYRGAQPSTHQPLQTSGQRSVHGPVYMLRYDHMGREFICVNGTPVYFDSHVAPTHQNSTHQDQQSTRTQSISNRFDSPAEQQRYRAGYRGDLQDSDSQGSKQQKSELQDSELQGNNQQGNNQQGSDRQSSLSQKRDANEAIDRDQPSSQFDPPGELDDNQPLDRTDKQLDDTDAPRL